MQELEDEEHGVEDIHPQASLSHEGESLVGFCQEKGGSSMSS